MNHVLYIDKPAGMTSFDVCFSLRKTLGTKKIGHTGTLDPMATGVMIVLAGQATKAVQFLDSDRKMYEADVLFGVTTDTLDIDGTVTERRDYVVPEKETVEEILSSFKGRSVQKVPMTSAVSVNGKRLYQYQRQGIEIETPEREIEVFDIGLLEMKEDGFRFSCEVSSGTYVRALTRDMLEKIDLTGTLRSLRRTAVDDVTIGMCDPLDRAKQGDFTDHSLYDLLSRRYETIDYPAKQDILNGKKIALDTASERVLIVSGNEALAVYEKDGGIYRCVRGLW